MASNIINRAESISTKLDDHERLAVADSLSTHPLSMDHYNSKMINQDQDQDQPPPKLTLTTLPQEIQQQIYSHVYPPTTITLLPDTSPAFQPKTLTRDFNILGSHPTSLLQTCSQICALAKPIRDASFSASRVDVSRLKDLAHAGYWVSHTVRVICFVPEVMDSGGWKLHLSLFPQLKRVVVAGPDVNELGPAVTEAHTVQTFVADVGTDEVFLEAAKGVKSAFFSPFVRIARPGRNQQDTMMTIDQPHHISNVEIMIHLRYTVLKWHSSSDRHTVGVTVRLKGPKAHVVNKVLRHEDQFSYWEAKVADLDSKTLDGAESDGWSAMTREVVTAALDDLPARFKWVRHEFDCGDVGFGDLP